MTDFACTQCEVLDGRFVCHVCDKVETPTFMEKIRSKIFHSIAFFFVSFTYFFRPKAYWVQFSEGRFRILDFLDNILIAVGFETACMALWSDAVDQTDRNSAVHDMVQTALKAFKPEQAAAIKTDYIAYLYGAWYDFVTHIVWGIVLDVGVVLIALPMAVPSLVLFNRNKETKFIPYVAAVAFLNIMTGVFCVFCITVVQIVLWPLYPKIGSIANIWVLWPQGLSVLAFLFTITGVNKAAFKTNIFIAFLAGLVSVAVGLGMGALLGVLGKV